MGNQQEAFMTKINAELPKKTAQLYTYRLRDDLHDEDNVEWTVDEDLKGFIEAMPALEIDGKNVHDIKLDDMEALKAEMAEKIQLLENSKEASEKSMKELEETYKRMLRE